ncbi:MAG TPA: DUF892 family protein, partial [Candidatus Dormibacteraeota bacterium]|nr:DUF892 family protein [Candidatus Dormibacteraeota bacterium]
MMKDLEKLFRSELNSIYDGERQLVEALNKLEQKAGSQELKTALKEHQLETREHVSRLKQVFGDLSETPKRKPCHGLTGIIDEALMAAEDFKGHPVLDAALVNAGQKAEHFEIATYGTLCSWADQLKYDSAAQFLKQTLSEEKNAEQKLRGLVDSTVESDGRPEFERDLKILFLRQMRELYDAENLLAAALPEVEFYAVS